MEQPQNNPIFFPFNISSLLLLNWSEILHQFLDPVKFNVTWRQYMISL